MNGTIQTNHNYEAEKWLKLNIYVIPYKKIP